MSYIEELRRVFSATGFSAENFEKMLETATPEEIRCVLRGTCICGKKLVPGPRGGMSQNVSCTCGLRFNLTPFGVERLC